ncbi:MAG TPA: L,D-transpeptidase family protein [Dongiaceae bacterium]|nr:L,D-transpeptidase family protein [Dongiaceae bacterium]
MDLIVTGNGEARWGERRWRAALGPTGIAAVKREGDGATPAGRFPMRRLLYRPDRLAPPATGLAALPLSMEDGWCDDPGDPFYNRPVRLPYRASHERLWRDDSLYDLIVVLGHNDDPVRPGAGSAVFLHVASPGYAPTQGCVALARADLLELLAQAGPGDAVAVRAG